MKRTDTQTLIEALRILAREIVSDDGVANACIYEAADRLEESCWRPIDTAPKTNGMILGTDGIGVWGMYWQSWYNRDADGYPEGLREEGAVDPYEVWEDKWQMSGNDCPHEITPTHWMPMPQPPKEQTP